MEFWFAYVKSTGEIIVSIVGKEFMEAGKRSVINGQEIIGLGCFEFEDCEDYKENWRYVVEGRLKEVVGDGVRDSRFKDW